MIVFGIDPGSTATGWAAVSRRSGRYTLHNAGTIRTSSKDPVPDRLALIHEGLVAAIVATRPDWIAIESIFRHRSSESALRLGQARGVALLAAAQAGIAVSEYNPMTIKSSVAGNGRADKKQVGGMVMRLLRTEQKLSADAADACAIAITHLVRHRLETRMVMAR